MLDGCITELNDSLLLTLLEAKGMALDGELTSVSVLQPEIGEICRPTRKKVRDSYNGEDGNP